jgi:hypothetical protein
MSRVCLELGELRPTLLHNDLLPAHDDVRAFFTLIKHYSHKMAENIQDWKREDEDDGDQEIDETVSMATAGTHIRQLSTCQHANDCAELQGAKGCDYNCH